MNTIFNGKKDVLVADITLPQAPVFFNQTMDVYTDAAIYFKSTGKRFQAPSSPMRFQMAENNLQLVLSSFTVNSILQTVLDTNLLVIPVNHHLVGQLFGFELTTTLLFAIVPELFYNYGHKNVSLQIQPITGTQVNWKDQSGETGVHATALVSWIIHEDSTTVAMNYSAPVVNKTVVAFESILDLDINLGLGVNSTNKQIKINIDKLTLNGLNVT